MQIFKKMYDLYNVINSLIFSPINCIHILIIETMPSYVFKTYHPFHYKLSLQFTF